MITKKIHAMKTFLHYLPCYIRSRVVERDKLFWQYVTMETKRYCI